MKSLTPQRCAWAEGSELMRGYHDEEWGVPLHDDRALFELLVLEGAQAGLMWEMILKRRDGYRAAFDGFRPDVVTAVLEAPRCTYSGSSRSASTWRGRIVPK